MTYNQKVAKLLKKLSNKFLEVDAIEQEILELEMELEELNDAEDEGA